MQDATPTTREWCLGLGFVRDRALTFEELTFLRREDQRLTRQGLLWMVIWTLVFVVSTGFGLNKNTPELIADTWAIWIVIGLPACVIGARLAFIARKSVRKELGIGLVKEFEGEATSGSDSVKTVQSLALLSATNRLWLINGEKPRKKWQSLPVAEVAATPEYASIAAQWLSPVPETGNLHLEAGVRELSVAEKNEIGQYVRSVYVRMTPAAVLFSCWFGAVLWFGLTQRNNVSRLAFPDSIFDAWFCCDLAGLLAGSVYFLGSQTGA